MTLTQEELTGLVLVIVVAVISYRLGYRKSTNDLFRAHALRASAHKE